MPPPEQQMPSLPSSARLDRAVDRGHRLGPAAVEEPAQETAPWCPRGEQAGLGRGLLEQPAVAGGRSPALLLAEPGQRHGRQATRSAQSDSTKLGIARMSTSGPTLWHISVSHYSEKARWALDHKQVPHKRRAVSDPRPAHPRLDAAHRRRQPHLPGARDRRAARSATRARSSPRWRSATPSGRSTPPIPSSAAARSSSRTSSTRSWGRTSACSPSTS